MPRDIDVAVIFRTDKDMEMKAKINEALGSEVDFQALTSDSIHSPIWLTLIKEGFSVKYGKSLAEIYHIHPVFLFKFSLKKLSNVQKVQFNRGLKNVLGKGGSILTRSVVLVPTSISSEFQEFLRQWDLYYESQVYELLPVMRKETFLS